MKHLTLNRVFAAYLVFFVLVVTGIVPRATVPYAAALLVLWTACAPLGEASLFFVRSVPLFIAIPLTAAYDNLNMWRPLALVLFARLLLQRQTRDELAVQWRSFRQNAVAWVKRHAVLRRLSILMVLAVLSLAVALHPVRGVVRIIYFVNLSLAPIVIYALVRRGALTTEQVIRNLAIPTVIVVIAGFVQLASTYFLDIYQFMRVWGEGIQLRQFGQQWSAIAVTLGNTWFAYYGSQLSLRMFSLFPDSHSFPTFVLLGIPALFAISLKPILDKAHEWPVRRLVRTYASLSIVWVPLAYLAVILSGTRGIWASLLGVAALAVCLAWRFRRRGLDTTRRRMFTYIALYLTVFLTLFALAWSVFISPQFLLSKGDMNLLGHRLRSIIDFGEMSNGLRLQIWKASAHSIIRHPLLGVGIGNFPVVLGQNIMLARAGSTAHNLYLHVAAETGVIAGLETIVLLVAAWLSVLRWFKRAQGAALVYAAALSLYLPWVLLYVLTDPIIFDERVFLMFGTTLALVWAQP